MLRLPAVIALGIFQTVSLALRHRSVVFPHYAGMKGIGMLAGRRDDVSHSVGDSRLLDRKRGEWEFRELR